MNSKDILKAIGDADDRFIEESAPQERKPLSFFGSSTKNAAKAPVESGPDKSAGVKFKKTAWKKWAGGIAAVLAVCVIGGAAVSGLWGSKKSAADYGMTEPEANKPGESFTYMNDYSSSGNTSLFTNEEPKADYDSANQEHSSASLVSSSVQNLNKDNLKLIYTANMSLQTSDFDKAEKSLSALVEQYKGYFESVKINNNGMYSSGTYRSGYYTVRIPAESYEAFVNAVGSDCHVVSLTQSVQDVGESYFELEGRLQTLYTKQERLQELLAKAESMYDIIELENALSDTEYQIDSYKGKLNHYDSLIGYSTVYISLETVIRPGSGITQDMSFGARLARAFKNGLSYAADNLEAFILWIAENIIGIIILAVIVILLIRFRPLLKLWRRIRKKDN